MKTKTLLIVVICFLLQMSVLSAQYNHEDVFPTKSGNALKESLINQFKPSVVLDYSNARDSMFLNVYRENGYVHGIYTDHAIYLPEGVDPSTHLYQSGAQDGINTEHTYPQSKGAEFGNARSDMHHLFPSRVGTNEARGSLPFAEVNDNQANEWFYLDKEMSNKPNSNTIDQYSERGNGKWEPRESVKGDIARAMFYFYTMYKDYADLADNQYFQNQMNILCEWHYLDPVDSLEWVRNDLKAQYQDGKRNPYILDCSLAGRAFCGNVPMACTIIPTIEEDLISLTIKSNPVANYIELSEELHQQEIQIVSLSTGHLCSQYKISGNTISVDQLVPGIYGLIILGTNYEKYLPIKFIKL